MKPKVQPTVMFKRKHEFVRKTRADNHNFPRLANCTRIKKKKVSFYININ